MRTLLLILAMIISCSCGRKKTNDSSNSVSVLRIDLISDPEYKVQKLSEFATNVEYIPLQTTDNSLMGGFTRKVVTMDKKYYVLNRFEILCFDMDGRFLFKLSNVGRGPEEYTIITDFDISSDNKNLTILTGKRLLIYEISDSSFVFQRSITLKDPIPGRVSLIPESNNAFLAIPPWGGTEPTLSLLINPDGDTIHFKPNCYKYEMVKKRSSRAVNEMLVYSIGNIVCFKEAFSDTIFYVDEKDNVFKPRLVIDSHGTLATAEMRGGLKALENNTTSIVSMFETSRYVFYWYDKWQEKPISNLILYDKQTRTKYKLDVDNELKMKLKDDLSGGLDFNIKFLNQYCSGDKLYSFVEAITLKKYVTSEDFKNLPVSNSKKGELKKIADSLKETDNPVLIVVTPKKNRK